MNLLLTDLVADVEQHAITGITVERRNGRIVKTAATPLEVQFLVNEYTKLTWLDGCGFTPRAIEFVAFSDDHAQLVVEDLGESEPVTDGPTFRHNCYLLLDTLREYGVRHGDLTAKNVIVKDNRPYLVDFHQSKYMHEPGPDKQPGGDAYWLWRVYEALTL